MNRKGAAWLLAMGFAVCSVGVRAFAAGEGSGFYFNDPCISSQWALYNDGSFRIEEEKNWYSVYEDPFGLPSDREDQQAHMEEPNPGGFLVEISSLQATAGIDINVSEAWELYGNGSHDTIVAMLDTGVDITHGDLTDAIWVNTDEIPGNGIDDDGNGYVDDVNGWNFYDNNNQIFGGKEDSHGTHGAGTIRANQGNGKGVAGIVPGNRVRIMPLKVLGGGYGSGATKNLIRAIRYAEENGAVICNLSLATTDNDPALYQAMASSSMLFIVSAGNGESDADPGIDIDQTPCYPAAYDLDNMICVANLNCDGKLHKTSNYGAKSVDLAAPGSYILSTTPGNSYGYMTGTSMAAPMVTGAAAMVYSYFDGIGPADVKEILLSTVTPLESLSGKTLTGGMLNVGAALKYDINSLSRSGFQKGGKAPENGNAPYLEARTKRQDGKLYLMVRALDVDGDLDQLLYDSGTLSEEYFAEGKAGTAFSVNDQDMATFLVTQLGTYTFYASDKNHNRTVYTIKIDEKR